jgi:signal transduction histidine kinase
VTRLPIRLRLTLPFAVGMAALLAAIGLVIYARVGGALLSNVDASLSAQVAEALPHAREGRHLLDEDVSDGPTVAQVQLADGTREDAQPASLPPLLAGPALRKVVGGARRSETVAVPGLRGTWRLREVPVTVDGRRAALVVGRSLSSRAETLNRLEREFLLTAPVALLISLLGGYLLAAAALRPVEAMRRRASVISATTPGRRLPVPEANDEVSALAVTLNEMLGRLEAALEHERRFVADASHELRTPLALLRAELELALLRPRGRDELEAALRSASEEAERLSQLAEDLLLIARADRGGIPLRLEEVDVDVLFERVRSRFAVQAEAAGRAIELERSGIVIEGDPRRLEQALGNLVENALVHGSGAIVFAAVPRDAKVELHVRDGGRGFEDAFLDRAFDRFSRADESRSSPGTGLGLSIVYAIASAHGGRAHAANTPSGGGDVWLELPLRAIRSAEPLSRETPTRA